MCCESSELEAKIFFFFMLIQQNLQHINTEKRQIKEEEEERKIGKKKKKKEALIWLKKEEYVIREIITGWSNEDELSSMSDIFLLFFFERERTWCWPNIFSQITTIKKVFSDEFDKI